MSNLTSLESPAATPISKYQWSYKGQSLTIAYETAGRGEPILLLPSFSTVSSRTEMSGLANYLSPQFQVTTVDFPGFGDSTRSRLDYSPPLYRQFLIDFIKDIYTSPIAIVAAGHAAGYAIDFAANVPNSVAKLVLVAPTWRGPLPTMAQGQKPWLQTVRDLIRTPILGQFLYQLNTTPSFLRFMYRRHVYADIGKLTPDLLDRKRQLTQQPGARFGAGAFVTGGLDPYVDRSDAVADLQSLSVPVTIAIGENSPPKSKAEMLALAAVGNVISQTLPGTLGLHEEYPTELYDAILPFLKS
ncbi:alpha/beta hydrolase [Chamaesiphon sp. VAR_48_metabat_135_sub]|uniref:alpha/beta fold hydrolase n=1 Tax=Chamaesiphon sp. VAR_48_metabat_135_sub TaxID=2964699 RepID=UPI00286A5F6B|nr:alpha/beta hydrolase [Chamaesiphon sp. VAR_48_metabat_135_sub]